MWKLAPIKQTLKFFSLCDCLEEQIPDQSFVLPPCLHSCKMWECRENTWVCWISWAKCVQLLTSWILMCSIRSHQIPYFSVTTHFLLSAPAFIFALLKKISTFQRWNVYRLFLLSILIELLSLKHPFISGFNKIQLAAQVWQTFYLQPWFHKS